MARIKITDLPKETKVNGEDLKRIRGGVSLNFAKIEVNAASGSNIVPWGAVYFPTTLSGF